MCESVDESLGSMRLKESRSEYKGEPCLGGKSMSTPTRPLPRQNHTTSTHHSFCTATLALATIFVSQPMLIRFLSEDEACRTTTVCAIIY